ncbi:MAG: hypothetical protein JSR40_19310 [Proteobacteria bacterium]|nr:hypothetical protein [Pseudomonadota bacterium]
MNSHNIRPAATQRGIVLIVGVVMLLMMTLIALALIRLGTRHTQVANNEQVRTEAVSAASYILDLLLNDSANTWTVYKGAGKTVTVNLGLSNTSATSADAIGVTLHDLTCRSIRILPNSEFIKAGAAGGINYVSQADASCFGGDSKQLTIVDSSASSTASGDSLCAQVLFEVQARTNAPQLLDANVAMTQGITIRRSVMDLGTCD